MNPQLRIILIDDNLDWCNTLKRFISGLNHLLETAHSPDEGHRKIADAEAINQHYAIAIIDMNFKEGDTDVVAGVDLVDHIKQKHPYMACIIASAERVAPDYVLDLRDERGVDYYLLKDRVSKDKVRKAIERSKERLHTSWQDYGFTETAERSEERALNAVDGLNNETYEEIVHHQTLIKEYQKRLRLLEMQAAQFGLQVPPHVQIEISAINEKIVARKAVIAALLH